MRQKKINVRNNITNINMSSFFFLVSLYVLNLIGSDEQATRNQAKKDEGSFHSARDHHDLKGATKLFTLTKCNT